MLVIPNNSTDTINIIGIDPGTTFLGYCVITVSLSTLDIISSIAHTLNGAKLSDPDNFTAQTYGDRFNRILYIGNELSNVFRYYKPLIICAESPFFGLRHPNAFQALTEVICTIRNAVYKHDIWMSLKLVPPSLVKQAIYAKGNATKSTMQNCICEMSSEFKYTGNTPLNLLDEHSIDALAVGYYAFNDLKNGYVK